MNIGQKIWAIPEGYIPTTSNGPKPDMESHDTICVLNTNDQDADIEITFYFSDKEPVGPYKITVPAKRTHHIRTGDLQEPEPLPHGVDYASVVTANVPIIVQYTRLDSRQSENALLSTMAYGADSHG